MSTESRATATRHGAPCWRRRLARSIAGAMAGLALALGAGAAPSAAAEVAFFGGSSFGTFANAKAPSLLATLGYTALLGLSCNGTNGKTLSNTVASLAAGKTLKADELLTTVFTTRAGATASLRNTATVSGLSLLDGLITATTVKAVANLSGDAGSITGSSAGSTLVGLKVAGKAVSADVAPNTKLTLPGVGYVIVNEVVKSGNARKTVLLVRMLDVNVTTANGLGLAVGTQILVAQAYGVLGRTPDEALVAGQAYAATANAAIGSGLQAKIGTLANLGMSCEGTGGKTVTNGVGAFSVANVLAVGGGQTTASGGQTSAGTVAKMTATVSQLSLLNGLVRAATVSAVAQEIFHDGRRVRSTAGSGLVGLIVASVPVSANVAPNTKLTLPGIGYVIVNEQIVPGASSTAATQVNGLRLVVTTANLLGLPVGAQIIVAHAYSSTIKPSTAASSTARGA